MKKIFFACIIVLLALQHTDAQTPAEKLETFRSEVLPQYNTYFTGAALSDKGQLLLQAGEKYYLLPKSSKKIIMDNLLRKWQESLVMVKYQTKSELWGWDSEAGKALSVDVWDINAIVVPSSAPAVTSTRTAMHPFFVYIGGQGILDSEKNLNAAINTRVGFFLLRNRWDLAWTFSGGVLGRIDSSSSTSHQLSTGLMSKFYFPIKKLNISPNIGFDVQSSVFTDVEGISNNSVSQALLAGISWYVGQGSLDFGVRISEEVTASIGYTLMPRFGKSKKNR